jgi:hypothetical protein
MALVVLTSSAVQLITLAALPCGTHIRTATDKNLLVARGVRLQRFFCYGHCVTGPSWKSGLGSLVLLLGPTVIFLVFVAPYMSARLSPAILVVRWDPLQLPWSRAASAAAAAAAAAECLLSMGSSKGQ